MTENLEEYRRFRQAIDAFEQAQADYDAAVSLFLRRTGWKYTCNNAGSFWLYEKRMDDGRTMMVSEKMALAIEQQPHPDIFYDDIDDEEPADLDEDFFDEPEDA